jgi:hypothetical protein
MEFCMFLLVLLNGIGLATVGIVWVSVALAPIAAGQDLTVEWKASLSDLDRRLPAQA